MTLTQHPLSAAFPAMPADEFAVLRADIKANGVREAITLYEGMVIDGWHRYSASQAEGVHCPSKLLGDGVDPVAFVISANLHRRHLTASQRALAVVTCSKWAPVGKAAKPAPGAGLQATNEQMAAAADVGERTIRQAKVVAAEGSEEVKEAVRSGAMSAKAGAEATRPAKPTQKPHAETTVATPRPQPEPPSPVKVVEPTPADPDPEDESLVDILTELQRENAELLALVKVSEADDLKAEALRWRRSYDNAVREQSLSMDKAAAAVKREDWTMRQLRRCGKAVNEDDPTRIAAAVEAMARQLKVVA